MGQHKCTEMEDPGRRELIRGIVHVHSILYSGENKRPYYENKRAVLTRNASSVLQSTIGKDMYKIKKYLAETNE